MDEELRTLIAGTIRETLLEIFEGRRSVRERPMPSPINDPIARLEEAVDRLSAMTPKATWSGSGCSYNSADITTIKNLVEAIDKRV